ncbi:MAG: ABC-F type ribosomal protection protein [Oscillospiraceae bacterium]|nr:ABC-F type ribosomal protection protein [Oscillospiraceae bacterium]
MSLINVQNLTFCYDGSYDNIFENVSFQLDTDWKLGFTGRNGRGKTTFLNLLLGRYSYSGTISATVDFEYFPYKVSDKTVNTIDIVEQIFPDYEYWQVAKELNLLKVDEDVLYRPFETLSNGEQTKVLLAVMFLKQNSFLLIDEPTNHLDLQARQTVCRYLNGKKGFILVSHDRAFLDGCVDHVLSINRNNIEIQQGNFSSWLHNKQLQDNFELAENAKLKKEIRRLEATAKEKANWSDIADRRKVGIDPNKVDNTSGYRPMQAAKAEKTMKRAKAIEKRNEKAVEEKSKLLKNIETSEDLKISQLDFHTKQLIYAENLSVSYDGRTVFKDLSFAVNKGDRVQLKGSNGSGKSSIIRLICGEDVPHSGTLHTASGLVVSYVPQSVENMQGNLTDYACMHGIDESLFKAILRKLDFARVQFEKDISGYSDGQKKKVLIAKSLCQKAHLHIWDEPMNYIDVISRMQIENLLKQYRPTLLFVEHDSAFCENIATKVIEL